MDGPLSFSLSQQLVRGKRAIVALAVRGTLSLPSGRGLFLCSHNHNNNSLHSVSVFQSPTLRLKERHQKSKSSLSAVKAVSLNEKGPSPE